ncbi:hypothetical protein IAE33_000251 [Pseudomonas sp. S60]|uniref:hypothetical protein n=1 Tax=Pseudomonas sp. S60 TaxID=211124 RepID=UPI0019139885|nr:hypothetical protein [Pseudomonas sp. S60]MBK5008391.1 hypothetical protein [Pseudomonas sp. S60]
MANTKKQDKPTPAQEQAGANPTDQALNSPHIGSDASTDDPTAGGTGTTTPIAESGVNPVQDAGGLATDVSEGVAPAVTSTEYAGDADVSASQPGQAGDSLHVPAGAAGLDEVNPAKVRVYPLRSFMDEGELRRRGGPGYQVPRRHAEELELRNLVSRTPLEE